MTTVRQSPLAGAEMMTFFAPAVMWPLAFSTSVNRPVDSITRSTPMRFPRQFRRRLGADDLDFLAVDDEHVVLGLVGGGFLRADRAVETALDGVVLEQVREVVRRNDIADGDDFDVLADQSLFDQRPEDQASNAAEPVNCNFYCHSSISILSNQRLTADDTGGRDAVNE